MTASVTILTRAQSSMTWAEWLQPAMTALSGVNQLHLMLAADLNIAWGADSQSRKEIHLERALREAKAMRADLDELELAVTQALEQAKRGER